jgi:hypothetical protein
MLKGYDPVAYFTDGKPVPARGRHPPSSTSGLDYRFVSDEHRKMFLANPQRVRTPKYRRLLFARGSRTR